MGIGIILKNDGIGIGIGIEKPVDTVQESEFGTVIRACIGIGIGKNIYTIPPTFSTWFVTMNSCLKF